MKPEHFCSGNMCVRASRILYWMPSMKPEHFCSGNGAKTSWTPTYPNAFNEAGAFLLRKLASKYTVTLPDIDLQ